MKVENRSEQFKNVLITNYECFCGRPECNSSVFRRQLNVAKSIVHVHGHDHVDVLDDLSFVGALEQVCPGRTPVQSDP